MGCKPGKNFTPNTKYPLKDIQSVEKPLDKDVIILEDSILSEQDINSETRTKLKHVNF